MIRFDSSSREPRPQLVPGEFTGELMKIEYHPTDEEVRQNKIPQFGPYLTFVFKIVEPAQFANAFRSGICSAKRHPRSKLAQWLGAFGVDITSMGDSLDEAALIGKRVKLKLEMDQQDRLKITSVWPIGGQPPVTPNAPVGFKPAARTIQPTSRFTPPSAPQQPPMPPTSGSTGTDTGMDMDDVPF